ncbi:MAG: O-antigen ligase domain-containing protein, partial [Lapillicoccus sp.]
PWFGVGLRWWYTDRFSSRFQPPNAEVEVLTTAGLLGLAAFVVLIVGSLVVLWRLPPVYGTLALGVVLSRFVQAQFDLFWVAAQVSVPFLIAGVCLGEATRFAAAQAEVETIPGREPMAHADPVAAR